MKRLPSLVLSIAILLLATLTNPITAILTNPESCQYSTFSVSGCAVGNYKCGCLSEAWMTAAAACIVSSCSPADQALAYDYGIYFCNLYGVNLATVTTAAVAVATARSGGGNTSTTPVAAGGNQNQGSGNSGSGGSSNIGAIVGGALGGFAVLCTLIGVMFYIWRTSPGRRNERRRTQTTQVEEEGVARGRPPFFPPDEGLARGKGLEKGGMEQNGVEIRAGNVDPVVPDERTVNESDEVAPSGRLRYLN